MGAGDGEWVSICLEVSLSVRVPSGDTSPRVRRRSSVHPNGARLPYRVIAFRSLRSYVRGLGLTGLGSGSRRRTTGPWNEFGVCPLPIWGREGSVSGEVSPGPVETWHRRSICTSRETIPGCLSTVDGSRGSHKFLFSSFFLDLGGLTPES